MSLPEGVQRRSFDGRKSLATRGPQVSEEPIVDGWRRWDPDRSKVGAMFEEGLEHGFGGGERVLYLGAASGTTVSHIADFAGPTYAVEFAPRPTRDLIEVATDRERLFPLLKDARKPETYAHIVEPVEVLVQDVATRGQADVALANRQFLEPDGRLLMAIKARSEDVTADPESVFEEVCETLTSGYKILDRGRLEPYHDDHLGVIATPRQ